MGVEGAGNEKKSFSYLPETVDWILVSIRSDIDEISTVYKTAGLLLSDGSVHFEIGNNKCFLKDNVSYYIVIEHRNHLAVMSHIPVKIQSNVLEYDFRKQGSYSSTMSGQKRIKNGIYAMFAGNGDQSETTKSIQIIDESDIELWSEQNGKNSSYFTMDLDMSGDVSIKDQELLYTNLGVMNDVPCCGF